MQVTSSGAAAAWDTPTIEPILPSSVNAYDPSNPDNGGTLDSSSQQQDSNAGYSDTAEPQPQPPGPAPGFEILYTKPLLVDPATGEALEVMHTKPLQISLDGSGPVDYGVNKPLQIDGAPQTYVGYNKPLLADPATGEALEVQHTKPLQISLDRSGPVDYGVNKPLQIDDVPQTYVGYNKPLLVDPATGEALEVQHTKPLQITPESAVQAASPDAANAVAAPKASAMEIAALELLLAEPANQEMIAQFGPPLAPLNTGTDVGSGIQARFGADLGARLTQLQEAQNKVRDLYTKAVDAASSAPGPGVAGCEYVLGTGGESGTESYWKFDAVAFSTQYAAGDSPAQKAFAHLHGSEPLRYEPPDERNESGGNPGGYFLGDRKLSLGYPNDGAPGMRHHGQWVPATLSSDQLSPEKNADLINKEYLWFDPVNGWSTDGSNIKGDWIDKAIPLVFAGGLTMITAGAFGITAASASTSLGQSMALGAISSASMQLTTGGKLDLGNILRSALTAGVTFGVMDASGVSGALQSTELATRTLGHLGKAGLQGLLQEATGGQFKDGLTNSLISSVAGEVGRSLESQIAELGKNGTLSVQEASTLRLMSRAASSAVRVAGSGGDAAGFASDFLGGLMEEANPFAGKAEAGGKADKAGKPNKSENTGNTSQGDKPDNGWVQSLGASDVDPTQAQGLRPGSSLQGLRVSGDALSGWGDEIDGGIALNGSMAPEARTTGEAVVGKGQGPLAALAAAGLSAQEQQAAYGQLLASGQVRLNAQGVPMVQPGQVLRFDLSDTSAAQLGGRAIAAESGGRAQRDAAAPANTNNAGGGRGFVNPAPASEYGNYPFAGRSTITDPSAYTDPRQRVVTLASMSDMPIDSFSAAEWRAAASEYKQIQGKDFSRDAIYNGLWTKAAALENAAGKGFSLDAINDITGFATEEGLHAQVGMAMGRALGRGIGNRLGSSVENVAGPTGGTPDRSSGVSDVDAASSRGISNNGGVEPADGASSVIGANGGMAVAVDAGSVKGVNPTGSTQNCTNCVAVVDNLLTTGNPASALPRPTPVPFDQLGQMYGTKFSGWTSQQNIESTLLAQGNGARAVIYGTDGATGHVWNAVVQNGKVNYIDGQIGGSGASNFKAFTNFQFGILP